MERDLKVLPKRVPRKECRESSSQVSMETFNSRTTKYSKTKNELKIYCGKRSEDSVNVEWRHLIINVE